jgi:hypothetical protein
MLAHPWKRKLVGQDLNICTDVQGTYRFREFKQVAETIDSGWVEY